MRAIVLCAAVLVTATASGAEPDASVEKLLACEYKSYSVAPRDPKVYDPASVLEIGEGYGHGGSNAWLRFAPDKGGVTVLSVRRASSWEVEKGQSPLCARRGTMTAEAYARLLKRLGEVDSAILKPNQLDRNSLSSRDFWVAARLASGKKEPLTWDWSGYYGSSGAIHYAKPSAAVKLARTALKGVVMGEHELTVEDRAPLSARFVREWTAHKDLESYWWVRANNIVLIGETGDASVYPALREALNRKVDDHCVPAAIYAVTRLTGKKLSTKPGEEDDVAKARDEALKLIPKK